LDFAVQNLHDICQEERLTDSVFNGSWQQLMTGAIFVIGSICQIDGISEGKLKTMQPEEISIRTDNGPTFKWCQLMLTGSHWSLVF
jgi:hypothetical protein